MADVAPPHDNEPEFYTFREGRMWICAWRRFDVVVQGPTEKIAQERMMHTVAAYAIDCAREGTLKLGNVKRPTPGLLAQWRHSHLASHGMRY
jgi:hypothetical protein